MEYAVWFCSHKKKSISRKGNQLFRKLNVAEIKLENGDLEKGDSILITGPSTGVIEYTAERSGSI